ncbi:hypothetical protein KVR01_011202 [Diaporthe batatas]|uniref:uncharacterized protein n=1 Tax=Diaporthe batatas TaxID=748121 RepID=UPI001D04A8C1|nr:uncharacterized protein KVR01_011202 [Diaporthe batatas]KAG8158759.1 hypothetical protein KVR01_011202 [Diaporthe batatas]
MDDNNRRRRQNEPPLQHTNTRYHQTVQNPTQQAHRTMAGTTTERYRPAPLNTSPQGGGARAGIGGGSTGYGAYYQEPSATGFSTAAGIHQNTMGYQQSAGSYGQDGRQTQNFAGSYNPTMMYNVPQATTQNPVYDTPGSSFDLRQPAAPQMMPADTTMTAQYFSNEPTNAAAASAMQQQQPSSAQAAAVYQQGPSDRNTMMNYPSNIAGMQTMGAQATPTAPPDVSMEDSSEYPGGADLNQAYTQYQDALKEIFKNIRDGALVTASESLLSVSEWLLSHVHELGLTSDDQNLHSDRIKLWNDFNHAWLATFQAQKELMESGRSLGRGQTLITLEGLKKLGDELIRLCDSIERHGLVDYQYGVWEEQITEIMLECHDLYSPDDAAGAPAAAGSSR